MPKATTPHPYQALTPDVILQSLESAGYLCNGSMIALNSYENRVYQLGLEEKGFIVVKFYRPDRWTDAAILEEHAFAHELYELELPVIAPFADQAGKTLHHFQGFRFAVYPRQGGRWPNLDTRENRRIIGRLLGRLHRVGALRPFHHRPQFTFASIATEAVSYLFQHDFIPTELHPAYQTVTDDLLEPMQTILDRCGSVAMLRIHGDCHPGNLLWREHSAHFVDLDDCQMGPAIQDIWMLLSGERSEMSEQLSDVLSGYTEFQAFPASQIQLIEVLRTLRMLHYSAWLARRWHDPAFPVNFPWFNSVRYWQDQILALREQAYALSEPALEWY